MVYICVHPISIMNTQLDLLSYFCHITIHTSYISSVQLHLYREMSAAVKDTCCIKIIIYYYIMLC